VADAVVEPCGIVQLAYQVAYRMLAERLLRRLHLFGGWFDKGRRAPPEKNSHRYVCGHFGQNIDDATPNEIV